MTGVQTCALPISLACEPQLLIADEPTTALDVTVQAQILDLLADLQAEFHTAIVLITHDLGVVAGFADRVMVMYAGKAVETAGVDDTFYHPRMPYTMGLLGSIPRIDEHGGSSLTPIEGNPPSLAVLPPGCPFAPRCPYVFDRCRTEMPALDPAGTEPGHVSACWLPHDSAARAEARQRVLHAEPAGSAGA